MTGERMSETYKTSSPNSSVAVYGAGETVADLQPAPAGELFTGEKEAPL